MVLSLFSAGGKEMSIEGLIARRKYAQAIELLKGQLKQGRPGPRLRLQLADVLVLAGQGKEAVPILIGLADGYAQEGFAAKAIALLKKIERIEPGRADVEVKLASLIRQEKRRPSPTTGPTLPGRPFAAPTSPMPEIGMEEIGSGAAEPHPMSVEDFELELVEVAHEALEQTVATATPASAPAAPSMASPLFSDFSEAELLAVMRGLRLNSYEPGDIIITEGEPGNSLFVLTTGTVKAFVRNAAGHHERVRELAEGAFFGEISILSGLPRSATVTAASHCELLELDRPTLDGITKTHPGVLVTLQKFYSERAGSEDERRLRG